MKNSLHITKFISLLTAIILLCCLAPQKAYASHIPGANITYTCDPSNPLQYTFTLTMFRRCPGTLGTTVSSGNFTISNTCGLANPTIPTFNQVGVARDVNQLCDSTTSACAGGSNPSVWMYTYEAVVTLPANCDSWNMAFALCCRDASSNLSGGSGNTMACSTTLNTATSPCNNSPVVTAAPIPYACTNTPFSYCLTTSDQEGDSVTYRMIAPATTGQNPIAHAAGFSPTAPLNGFTLDPLTGCISFNHPNTGNYVVAFMIEEYDRNGNLKSAIVHDFQILVINCTNTPPNNPIGGITNVSGNGNQVNSNTIAACVGQSFCFDVTFEDLVDVNDTIIVVTDALNLFPGATFTQTGVNPVVGTFCWTVVPGNTGTVATFIGEDDGCPVKGTSALGVNIDIIQGVYAGPDASVCGGTPVQMNATGGSTFNWSPATGLSCTNCPNPIANPAVTTTYTVTGNLSGSCSNSDQVTITVENVPPTATITGNIGICTGGAITSNTLTATGGTNYLWNTGATTNSIVVSPGATTDYSVIVTNFINGCEAYDTATVTVAPVPEPRVRDITICNGNSGTLEAFGGGTYLWNTGATTSDLTVSPLVTTDYIVTVTLGSCAVQDTGTITVTPTSGPVLSGCSNDTTLSACNPVLSFDPPTALDYCAASPCIPSDILDIQRDLNTNGATIAANVPSPYAMLDGLTGTCISDGGNDMYDCGNQLNTDLGTLIPYTNGVVNTHPAFGGGSYFTAKYNNLWVMTADLNGVSSFFTTGNNGADGRGNVDGFTYTVAVGCLNYYVFVKRINGAGDPSINQVFIVPDNGTSPAPTHTFATNTNDGAHTLTGLSGFDRIYFMLLAGTGGIAYTDAQIQAAVLDFLTQSNAAGGGVASAPVTQIAGPASGSTFPVGVTTVTFQATGVGGNATCSFDVTVPPNNGPVITCRVDTTVGECASVVNFGLPQASDPCNATCANATIGDVLADLNTNGATIAAGVPSPYAMLDGLTGTCISDGGNDMYDCGNQLNTDLGTLIPYTNGVMSTSPAFGGGSYFTAKYNNLWVMTADLNGVSSFFTTGNNGADGSGNVNGFTYTVTVGCLNYYVFVKRINGAGDPSINQVFIVPDNGTSPAPTHTFATNTNDGAHTLTGLSGFDRIYFMLLAGSGGIAYTDAQIQTAVLDFLNQANTTSGILAPVTITQIGGLASGSTFPVGTNTVTFRATSTVSGISNDCSFDVIVDPNPTAAITGNTTTCSGVATALTATGGGTYLWSTGETTATVSVSPLVNTNYTVTVTDNNNCTDDATTTVTMTIPSTAPVITPITGTQCPNTSLTLNATGGTASTGSTIEWYTGANGTGTNIGSGASVTMIPTGPTTTYYARREGGCNTTPDDQIIITLKDYVYALNATNTNTYCTDNSGWHHFFNGNEIYLSVRGDLSGAPVGSPVITINDNGSFYQQTQGPFTTASCVNGYTPGEERFEMERSWNVNFGGGTLNPPYDVRFYYQPAERTAIEVAAANHIAANPACGYAYKYAVPQGFYFFKNVGADYTAPDYDGLQLPFTNNTTSNGINYSEMTGITSFSGGSGGIILVPNTLLATDWLYFEGTTDNKTNFLRWATETEQNTDYFNLQRSANGTDFTTITKVNAAGNTTVAQHYAYDDKNPFQGENYYRIELVDLNGQVTYSNTILLNLAKGNSIYTFYPNPTNDVVNYEYEATKEQKLSIEVIDVYGRTLTNITHTTQIGLNQIPVSLTDYAVGTYVIKVHHLNSGAIHTTKIIKTEE
jgi:hypothetical protein